MGQCKYTQTAIYKGVPKAVGGKKKISKNLIRYLKRKWKTSKMYFLPNGEMALRLFAICMKGKDTSTAKTQYIFKERQLADL